MRIYVDLDDTLVTSEIDPQTGFATRIHPRPGAYEFLEHLSEFGPVRILTRAQRGHANLALSKLGEAAGFITETITRDQMGPVEDQLEAIFSAPISEESKRVLVRKVKPIFPKGVIFDNDEPWSDGYLLKTKSTGAGFDEWIQVEPFDLETPDLGGLEKAFSKFLERRPGLSLGRVHAHA